MEFVHFLSIIVSDRIFNTKAPPESKCGCCQAQGGGQSCRYHLSRGKAAPQICPGAWKLSGTTLEQQRKSSPTEMPTGTPCHRGEGLSSLHPSGCPWRRWQGWDVSEVLLFAAHAQHEPSRDAQRGAGHQTPAIHPTREDGIAQLR